MNPLIQSLTEGQLRTDIPAFQPGDTCVHCKVKLLVLKKSVVNFGDNFSIEKICPCDRFFHSSP